MEKEIDEVLKFPNTMTDPILMIAKCEMKENSV